MNQPYSQKPFVVTYHGKPATVFASSQMEAERIIREIEESDFIHKYQYVGSKEKVQAFGQKLAEAMVKGLNEKVKKDGYEPMEIPKDLNNS